MKYSILSISIFILLTSILFLSLFLLNKNKKGKREKFTECLLHNVLKALWSLNSELDIYKIPSTYYLTIDDVVQIKNNNKYLHVIEPQSYNKITFLDKDNFMFTDEGALNSSTGYFYESGQYAVSGSGSDIWIVIKPGLETVLSKL